jgi:hypothetical protein
MVKERLDISDSSQDAKITAKLTQANRILDGKLKLHTTVPVTTPTEVVNLLTEVEADLAAGLLVEDRGPSWKDQATVFKKRADEGLETILSYFRQGTVITG